MAEQEKKTLKDLRVGDWVIWQNSSGTTGVTKVVGMAGKLLHTLSGKVFNRTTGEAVPRDRWSRTQARPPREKEVERYYAEQRARSAFAEIRSMLEMFTAADDEMVLKAEPLVAECCEKMKTVMKAVILKGD